MKRLQVSRNQKSPYQTSKATAPYLFSNNGNKVKLCGKEDLAKLEQYAWHHAVCRRQQNNDHNVPALYMKNEDVDCKMKYTVIFTVLLYYQYLIIAGNFI